MSSLPPSTTERTTLSTPVQPAFDWIEVLAIPLSFTIMETQPIVLLLLFIAQISIGPGTPLPVSEVSITLLLLGLQWWAMFINRRLLRTMSQRRANILHILAVAIAFGLIVGTQLTLFNPLTLVVIAALVIFCWKRGIDKAKVGLDDEQIMLVFKLGLGILLVVLCLSVLFPTVQVADVFPVLTYALPLFFLSGLICLSFVRMGMIRREHSRQGVQQVDPTRGWLLALTFVWIVLVAGTFALEIFSFNTIQALLLPLLNIVLTIIGAIIYVIAWVAASIFQLLGLLFHVTISKGGKASSSTQQAAKPSLPKSDMLPAWLFSLLEILIIAVLLFLLFLLFRAILRHIRPPLEQDSEEEIREILSMRDILRQRRQDRKQLEPQKEELALETLDPASARALYRELLLRMAEHGEHVGRQPEETPDEYQERLLALVEQSTPDTVQDELIPDRVLLADLTRAYTDERYGGKQAKLGQYATMHAWIARLTEQLRWPVGK